MNELQLSLESVFFQRAAVEAVLVGVMGGIAGVHVLLRRLPFYVVALSHATLPGVVLASVFGVSIFVGGWIAGAAVAVAVALLGRQRNVSNTNAVGVVLAGSFAVGVLLLSAGVSQTSRDLTAFLVGSILTVTVDDLIVTAVAALVVMLLVTVFHKELLFSAFDPAGARAQGYRLSAIDLVVLLVVTAVVVVVIPAVGTLLALTLLTVPAMAARLWCTSVAASMVCAAVVGAVGAVGGLVVSAVWQIAAGGAIALSVCAAYFVALAARKLYERVLGSRPSTVATA